MSVETLAQAMLEAGILDAPSVEQRVPRSRTGRQLLDGLVTDGLITEPSLVSQLARALSVPRYDPKERSPEPDAMALLDLRNAEELGVLPVAVRGGGALLWVALCDPTDEGLLAEVARRTGRRVKACLIGPRELARALQLLQPGVAQPGAPSASPFQVPNAAPNAMPSGQFRIPLPAAPPPGLQAMAGYPVMPNGIPSNMQPTGPYAAYGLSGVGGPAPMMPPGMPGMPSLPPGNSQGPVSRSSDTQRLEDELAQVRQVVKVLTQLLVERGLIDGEELKRRLRAERERK